MEPHCLESTLGIPPDKGVRAVLGRILNGLELCRRHVSGIEVGSCRLVAITIDERLAIDTVPWAIVYAGKFLEILILQGFDRILVSETLHPVYGIGLVCSELVKIQYFLSVVCDSGEVGSGYLHKGVLVGLLLDSGLAACVAGTHESKQHDCQSEFLHG